MPCMGIELKPCRSICIIQNKWATMHVSAERENCTLLIWRTRMTCLQVGDSGNGGVPMVSNKVKVMEPCRRMIPTALDEAARMYEIYAPGQIHLCKWYNRRPMESSRRRSPTIMLSGVWTCVCDRAQEQTRFGAGSALRAHVSRAVEHVWPDHRRRLNVVRRSIDCTTLANWKDKLYKILITYIQREDRLVHSKICNETYIWWEIHI